MIANRTPLPTEQTSKGPRKGEQLTRLITLGVLLQLNNKVVKLLLALVAALQTPLLQLRVVLLEKLLVGRGEPVGEGGTADADCCTTVYLGDMLAICPSAHLKRRGVCMR